MNKIIFAIIISAILLSVIAISGCTNLGSVVDPCKNNCENQFSDCNHRCGEGILSSLCKESCTSDYNKCLSYC